MSLMSHCVISDHVAGALGLVANQECGWVGAANPWTASPGGTFYANEKAAYLPAAAPIVITQTSGVSASCSVELAMFQMNATPSSNGNV